MKDIHPESGIVYRNLFFIHKRYVIMNPTPMLISFTCVAVRAFYYFIIQKYIHTLYNGSQ